MVWPFSKAQSGSEARAVIADSYFSPGDDCRKQIIEYLARSGKKVDICVFTITDDRISRAIIDAHRRGVDVRIITDNEKALDRGSDVDRLARGGIPVRVDRTMYHMHHKFALFDGSLLLTGSYNWTRTAAESNEENFIVSSDPRFVVRFSQLFEDLWKRFE